MSAGGLRGLRVGVLGAGAIGRFVGGRLGLAQASDQTVTYLARGETYRTLRAQGYVLRDLDQRPCRLSFPPLKVTDDYAALGPCDVVLVCVKSTATIDAARALQPHLAGGALVVSLQNGLHNAAHLDEALGTRGAVAGIVSFNVISLDDAGVQRTMDGPLHLARSVHPAFGSLVAWLTRAGLDTVVHDDLRGEQWAKLAVNLNNAVSALTGWPTVRMLQSRPCRRIMAALVDEALVVMRAAGIRPASLRGVPLRLMPPILRLPTPLVRLIIGAQMRIDPEARSSMWEDLERGRCTEVAQLNGEVVAHAAQYGVAAPFNARIVQLVRAAEAASTPGSPQIPPEVLAAKLGKV